MSGRPEKRRKVVVKREPSLQSSSPTITPPPANLPRTMSADKYTRAGSVTLLVGPNEEEFLAHIHHVTRDSSFFQAEIEKERLEGQKIVIKLPGEEVEVVTHYLDFVYGEGLPIEPFGIADDISQSDESDFGIADDVNKWDFVNLIKLYTLGERISDTTVRNAVIKEIIRLFPKGFDIYLDPYDNPCLPMPMDAKIIYDGTPKGSPARRLLVDLQVSGGVYEMFDLDGYSPDYLRDLTKALLYAAENHIETSQFPRRPLKADDYLL